MTPIDAKTVAEQLRKTSEWCGDDLLVRAVHDEFHCASPLIAQLYADLEAAADTIQRLQHERDELANQLDSESYSAEDAAAFSAALDAPVVVSERAVKSARSFAVRVVHADAAIEALEDVKKKDK